MDLAGVELEAVNLEVRGRTLVITGERTVRDTEGRVYQQVEFPRGPFRREVESRGRRSPTRPWPPTRTGSCESSFPPACRRRPARSRSSAPSSGRSTGKGTDMADVETPQLEVVEIPDVEEIGDAPSPCPTPSRCCR